jgi:hypothetical protein
MEGILFFLIQKLPMLLPFYFNMFYVCYTTCQIKCSSSLPLIICNRSPWLSELRYYIGKGTFGANLETEIPLDP